ncbi:multiple sugar transport system permease protein [Kribbella aluminosa]|uniref:Multiple sugar transport system permease protein n=1 Tax=Kribbella aluminosa TaxID=416017 RepID=A0ABS4UWU9_9ACTN|nr:sugar ABC transporter permease [Kribbella aluminosa]MBP2356128.1 multiple sugar transport system permease protein [Kribbella aluminosa]
MWLLPGLIGTLVFAVFPFLNTIALSFTNAPAIGGGGRIVGLANYREMLGDSEFWQATTNSLCYMAIATPLLIVLPLLLALLVEKQAPFVGVFRTGYYVPVLTSVVVAGIAWQFLLQDRGLVNTVLGKLHLIDGPLPFLTDQWLLLLACIAVTVWKGAGWYMVLYLVALGNVDQGQLEAARIDGAGAVRRVWYVILPAIRPVMLLVGTLAAIGSLRVFAEVYMLGGPTGGPGGVDRTLPFLIRDAGLDPVNGNAGYGAAISVGLFLLTLVVALLGRAFVKEETS